MARTAAFRKWNGAHTSTHPSPTLRFSFVIHCIALYPASCLIRAANAFHFRRRIDRSIENLREEISREGEFERVVFDNLWVGGRGASLFLFLSLSCLPEIRISFGRKPIARNPSRPGICPKSAFAPHTHTYTHALFHTRFFQEIRSKRRVLSFFF